MINKENNTIDEDKAPDDSGKPNMSSVANMDINCHILIKDKDTQEVLLNKRG